MKLNILVPIDFTNISDAGLRSAINIANKTNGIIYLFHVIGENNPNLFRPDGDAIAHQKESEEYNHIMIELIDKSKEQLHKIISNYSNNQVEFIPIIEVGDFKEKLDECLKLVPIDLIIMGTSGETSIAEFFSGNHTAQVMQTSNKPVLAVKDEITANDLHKLLILTDLRDHEHETIKMIRDFAEIFNMKVLIAFMKKNKDLIEDNLYKRLEKFATESGFNNYSLHIIGKGGKIKSLKKFTEKHDINLVATISEMESGMIRLFFGNLTEELVEKIDQPVMAVSD